MLDLTKTFSSFPILKTERLLLRAITFEDVDAIFRIMNNPQVTRFFGHVPMQTRSEAVQRVEGIQAAFREQRGIRWAITSPASNTFLGSCGFWRIEQVHERAEIGYELASEWWGQGLMTEAIGAVLRFGFMTMRLHSIEAQIHPANIGSRRVLEKVGFVQEGYFHENYYDPVEASFTDTAVFSFVKTDWLRRGNE